MTTGSTPPRVLIVDDEPPIRRFLRTGLTAQGLSNHRGGKRKLMRWHSFAIASTLVVLDLGLPDIDGLEVLRKIRASGVSVAVIILSSRSDETGKVTALDLGADDYVTKPFGMDELLARVRAALRHRLQQQGERPVFRSGDLTVDLVRRVVTVRGEEVKLTPREYDLFRLLVCACGQGADPQAHPARDLGFRGRRPISSHLHQDIASEDRGSTRAATTYPH